MCTMENHTLTVMAQSVTHSPSTGAIKKNRTRVLVSINSGMQPVSWTDTHRHTQPCVITVAQPFSFQTTHICMNMVDTGVNLVELFIAYI